jgi:hypothetical protein
MRRIMTIGIIMSIALCGGCVTELNTGTQYVSDSIGDLIRQQVVSNLVQAYKRPYSLPSQAVLNQGVITVQNTASLTTKLPYTVTRSTDKEVDPGLSLQWSGAWTVNPVMDGQDAARLEYLYLGATSQLAPQVDVVASNDTMGTSKASSSDPGAISVPPASSATSEPTLGESVRLQKLVGQVTNDFSFGSYISHVAGPNELSRPDKACADANPGAGASTPAAATVAAAETVAAAAAAAANAKDATANTVAAATAAVAAAAGASSTTTTTAAAKAAATVSAATERAAEMSGASAASTAVAAAEAAAAAVSASGTQTDPLQSCIAMTQLLNISKCWLFIRPTLSSAKPSDLHSCGDEKENRFFIDPKDDADDFQPQGSAHGYAVLARPKQFAQFVLFILDATPNTQASAANGKGIALSVQ